MKNRRQFLRLTALTLGGMAIGCGDENNSGMGNPDSWLNPQSDSDIGEADRGVFPDASDAEPFEPEEVTNILDGLPDTAAALDEIMVAFFGEDQESIQIIGQTYLVDLGEMSAQEMADILSPSLTDIAEESDPEQAAEQLHEQVDTDFTDVRLENVRGWWLAETEVHLCTLAFLLRAPSAPTAADLNVDIE